MTAPTFRLVMQQGPTPGQTFDLVKAEMFVGRDVTNDIVINDPEVSRRHARFSLEAGRYILEDLGSTNGSFVNGQRLIGPHSLAGGEHIMFGENVALMFEAVGPQFDATLVAALESIPLKPTAQPVYTPPPVAAPAYAPPPTPAVEQPFPAYSGQVPAGPVEAPLPAAQPKKGKGGKWILAGCGCLVLIVICLAAVVLIIDHFSLWCTIFGSLIPGCGF